MIELGEEWTFLGPGGWNDLDNEGIPSSGAAQAAHMVAEEGIWLIGAANGGIWRTENITKVPNPQWTNVLDGQEDVPCTSISAMHGKGQIVVAGCGASTSSEMGTTWDVANSGDWAGAILSTNGGLSWTHVSGFPMNYYVSAVSVVSEERFLIAVRSRADDGFDGGVWSTRDGGKTFERIFHRPVFDMKRDEKTGRVFLACPFQGATHAVYASDDNGESFREWSEGISWNGERQPFYPTLALGKENIFLGALTVNPSNLSDTNSDLFRRELNASGPWEPVKDAPRLDQDGMPKDRMALLVAPDRENDRVDEHLFVAGNADALVWRVQWRDGTWTRSGATDTADKSYPHADCRQYYWEPSSNSLLLLNDGGAHLRTNPFDAGAGTWRSITGRSGSMELITAYIDPKHPRRWIGGAQDNCVQIFDAKDPLSLARGIVEGDGTVTAVDPTTNPSRLYGTTQFMGNFIDDDAGPNDRLRDDDDDHVGFAFATISDQGEVRLVGVPLLDWFSVEQFPFFEHPFALTVTNESVGAGRPLVLWSRRLGGDGGGAFYTVDTTKADTPRKPKSPFGTFPDPVLDVATDGDVYAFVSGGIVDGRHDDDVLVALNDTHLLHRSGQSEGLVAHRLPVTFARPVEFTFLTPDTYILGPVSHKSTVSLAVAPDDASFVAVTGWQNLSIGGDVGQKPRVFLTADAGATFHDVTGDLFDVTGVCAGDRDTCFDVRPSSLLILPARTASRTHTILVGVVAGVYVLDVDASNLSHFDDASIKWRRLGTCEEFPLVLVGGLSYEPSTDTVVAATMGRGVRALSRATMRL
eukprot:g1272.t1